MKKRLLQYLHLLATVFTPSILLAEVKLPSIFGDNMVLQRETNALLWGKASPDKVVAITVSWDKKNYSVRADDKGNWKITIKTPEAGGPYAVNFKEGKTITLNNVLIGEVWVCSGQSNMEMIMKGYYNQPVLGSNEAIARSSNKLIRLFTVEKNTSLQPLDDFTGQWQLCLPENVSGFSAAAYYFGKKIQEVLKVPVGLVCTSWGGTRIEPWMSETACRKFNWVAMPDEKDKRKNPGVLSTTLYNAMIHPMVGYAMKGAIWYQGEANRNESKQYEKLLPGLIQDWRDNWGIGDFPFYYVQIAPNNYPNTGLLREAQRRVSASTLPNIGMACIVDINDVSIHPANKELTGNRLAYLALAKAYGINGIAYSGPVLKAMTVDGSTVNLTFDYAQYGLTTFGKDLVNFKVAGEDKRFYSARAKITKTGISLSSPDVPKPVAVRYAFDDFVAGELYNTEGLPASSFRIDEW